MDVVVVVVVVVVVLNYTYYDKYNCVPSNAGLSNALTETGRLLYSHICAEKGR